MPCCLSVLPIQVNSRGSNLAAGSPNNGNRKTVLNGAASEVPSRGAELYR